MSNSNWTIRNAVGDDLPFIYATWARSYRYDSPLGRSCRNSIFFPNFNKVIDWIMNQDDTRIVVASDPNDSKVIYGYLVHQPDVVHYVFTKEIFCNFGIAKSLFNYVGGATYCSHKTLMSKDILDKHPEIIYNPFLLFKQGIQE
jgi:hypothetical protein